MFISCHCQFNLLTPNHNNKKQYFLLYANKLKFLNIPSHDLCTCIHDHNRHISVTQAIPRERERHVFWTKLELSNSLVAENLSNAPAVLIAEHREEGKTKLCIRVVTGLSVIM